MKKLLIALVLGLLLIAALATVASADNGPHGNFSSTTDACAGCHRVHTAKSGANTLLVMSSVDALCLSCHGGTSTNAYTNVESGFYRTGGTEGVVDRGLFGGGFVNARMRTDWVGNANTFDPTAAASKPVSSIHNREVVGATTWGSGNVSAVAFDGAVTTATTELECTSCHTPHGNGGQTVAGLAAPSYRLLRYTPTNSGGFTVTSTVNNFQGVAYAGFQIDDPAFGAGTMAGKHWYTPNFYGDVNAAASTTNDPTLNAGGYVTAAPASYTGTLAAFRTATLGFRSFANGDYSPRPASARNPYRVTDVFLAGPYMQPAQSMTIGGGVAGAGTYVQGSVFDYTTARRDMSFFCAQCHDRYFNNGNLRAGVTPSGDAIYMFRHSSGDYRAPSDGVTAAGSGGQACMSCHMAHGTTAAATTLAASASKANSAALLRLDNRAICLKCHAPGYNIALPVQVVP